jgi:metal-responsive CopG/Arc/MetJ family transcriptional regulator
MTEKRIHIRIDDSLNEMLDELVMLEEKTAKELNNVPKNKSEIIKTALKEYYAKQMDVGTTNSYLSLVSSTLNNILSNHLNVLRDDLMKNFSSMNSKMDFTNISAMMMFAWFTEVTAGEEDNLDDSKVMKGLELVNQKGFRDVFESYVTDQVKKIEEK